MTASLFTWPVRVYWEDTDAGGIVYFANYLKFMERARTEWLRAMDIEQGVLQQEHGLIFVVVDTQIEFKSPARYGDALTVTTRIQEHTRVTVSFKQEVLRGGADGELLVAGALRAASLDSKLYRPCALPKTLLEKIAEGNA